MLQIIITIIGLIIGIAAFMALVQAIPSVTHNKFIAIFVFIILFGAGIWVAYIAWWLAIIIGIISLIVYAVKKKKPLEINEDLNNTSSETKSNDNNTSTE